MSRNKSVVVNITGPPGVGKTWFAMAFAQFFDPKFHIIDAPAPDPWIDTGQVCFEREHIMFLVGENSPLKRGQVIVLDEAHFGMGARGFQQKDQVSLVNLISAIRSKGFMLIIVTLHSSMLDKIPREYVVGYEFAVKDEGIAKVYRRYFPTFAKKAFNKGKGTLEICMPDPFDPETGLGCDDPGCLGCKFMKATNETRCFNIRAIYERRKEEFINKMSANDAEAAEPKKTQAEIIEIIHENRDRLKINAHNRVDVAIITDILQENGLPCSINVAYKYRNAYETAHPHRVDPDT